MTTTDHLDADVCVVGAGYAGLTVARRLAQAGRSVIVLEARDRVGGRVWTGRTAVGAPLDFGGTWFAPKHNAVRALAAELGCSFFPTFTDGATVFVDDAGRVSRYRGAVPRIGPLPLLSLGQGMFRIDRMARSLPLAEPWRARHAASWDARTIGDWLDRAIPTATAKHLLRATVRGLLTAEPAEVSMLDFLYLVRSAGSMNTLLSIPGGYQQDMMVGGAQTLALVMAKDLGESLRLDRPVRRIAQDSDGVTVEASGATVRARHAVVAAPPVLASEIVFEPALPRDRTELMRRMPAGALMKAIAVYDDAFWRRDGARGESVSMRGPVETTLDASPASGAPGVLVSFAFGRHARALRDMPPDERRRMVIDGLMLRFGEGAARPAEYHEHEWESEAWTRGCSLSHMATGVLTSFGPALRTPCRRIHWAGTETAMESHGAIDGAVRSGERAARECIEALQHG
jgi:monoamine oxidase